MYADEQILQENEIDTKSYDEVEAGVKNILTRLKYLSEKLQILSTNVANEIADAARLL